MSFILQAEVEETLKRIEAHKGVIGTIIVNAEGNPKYTDEIVFFDVYNAAYLYT